MWAVLAAAIWVCALATPQPLHLERDSFRRPEVLDWRKRDESIRHLSHISQFMLRSTRGVRQYDVPQIEIFSDRLVNPNSARMHTPLISLNAPPPSPYDCPPAPDGMDRFACPSADRRGRYHCIDDHVLCDGFADCPYGEDEDRQACMFYKTTKAHLDVLADALLRWARGR